MAAEREHGIVLLGATGFTGALTAEYLCGLDSDGTKLALAGRNMEKLTALRDRLGADLPLLEADVTDPGSLRALAESTKVVVSTVGPYIKYGEPLVAACAAAGTDYLDLTGEPEFVDLMYVRHHATAVKNGARLVHCCGFDSIPHDLGAQFTVDQLPEHTPIKVEGFVRAGGRFSGGTAHSAITAFSRFRQWRQVAGERKRMEERPEGRKISGLKGAPHREADLGWVMPMPTIDPQIVLRSARALARYGPDFSYGHYMVPGGLPAAVALTAGVGAAGVAAQIPPARKFLLGRIDPGDGPTPEQRAKGWFKVRFHGAGGGERTVTEVAGGDPGYTETAKMLAESALCMAKDDLPSSAGQVTTAQAMGPVLRARLERAGISFSVLPRT